MGNAPDWLENLNRLCRFYMYILLVYAVYYCMHIYMYGTTFVTSHLAILCRGMYIPYRVPDLRVVAPV